MATQTPKGQPSARLLTMKFMQRAAATGSSPTTPKSEDEHSIKRRRVSGKASPSTPSAPLFDQKAVQAALEEEERKRQAALEKQALELGDSRWVLDVQVPASKAGLAIHPPLNVVQVGFAQIDSADIPEETLEQAPGTRSFGPKSKKRKEAEASDEAMNSDSGGAASSDQDSESDTSLARDSSTGHTPGHEPGQSASKRVKSDIKNRQREEQVRAQQFAEKRRKKEVKLNKLVSISSAGGPSQSDWKSRVQCHACGKTGHKQSECPNKRSR